MKALSGVVLVLGIALFAVVLYYTDLTETWERLRLIHWTGAAVIVLVYFASFLCDTATWYMTIRSASLRARWVYRLWQVMMYGDALNKVLPLASFGGEPVKALLVKRHLEVGYREITASLILFHTVSTIGLVAFSLVGLVLLLAHDALDPTLRTVAGIGMGLFSAGVALFYVLQRFQALSRLGAWVSRERWGRRVQHWIALVRDVEDRLVAFYTREPKRFGLALAYALLAWALGLVEIYFAMMFLGYPITWSEAWIIEAVVVMVRSALFVVPAAVGTQEGAFVAICAAIAGSPAVGLAVSAVIRVRGIVWIVWGLLIGWRLERLRPVAEELEYARK